MKNYLEVGCVVYTPDGKRGITMIYKGVPSVCFESEIISINNYKDDLIYIVDKMYNSKKFRIDEIYKINDDNKHMDFVWKREEI